MKTCYVCILVKVLAGIGALNWLLVAFFNINLVTMILGDMTMPAKIVYGLVGVAGILTLVSIVKACPCGCKS